ncbi:MAG: exodeoxyribonuclease VII large subunit [Pseudobdellovibrionaceae bacterium]
MSDQLSFLDTEVLEPVPEKTAKTRAKSKPIADKIEKEQIVLQDLKVSQQTVEINPTTIALQQTEEVSVKVKTLEQPQESEEPTVFSVEQLNKLIRGTLEKGFNQVWVRGELSNFKAHTSGHFYFSLKDSQAQIRAVMFRGANARLKFRPHDGLEVLIRGKITVYEQRGDYQITCDMMEPVGAGALQKAFEQLKENLKKEGLFDAAKKRAIPHLPKHVAIVTSPTGAAIRDMINVLARRARNLEITIVPTIVQGADAAPQIVEALRKATQLPNVDVIIIGRGGGSIEDLWAFNDEKLARAISASPIPVISAVGHEIDFTIADFVSDLRAPTPSAAAELVVKNVEELNNRIESLTRLLKISLSKILTSQKQALFGFSKRLIDPKRRLQELVLRNDDFTMRLQSAMQRNTESLKLKIQNFSHRLGTPEKVIAAKTARFDLVKTQMQNAVVRSLEHSQGRFAKLAAVLDSISPLQVVSRGYSLVYKDKKLLKSSEAIKVGDRLQIQFAKGAADVEVKSLKEN